MFRPEFKARAALEEITGVRDKSGIWQEYRLMQQIFSRWREEFLERWCASHLSRGIFASVA
jgi:hypothetical protein